MEIDTFVWPDDRIEHIARHGVTPEEVEEACRGRPRSSNERDRMGRTPYIIFWDKPTPADIYSVLSFDFQMAWVFELQRGR